MKKLLLFAALVLGTVSCMKDNSFDANVGGEADVVLSVALPSDVTRALNADSALGAIDNIDLTAEYDIRYILEVFDANDDLAKRVENYEDSATSTTFELRLIPGRHYSFVVWADFVAQGSEDALHYNAEDLRNIEIIGAQNAMDESRDAYTGIFRTSDNGGQPFSSSSQISFELKRPFAKLRVVTNDIDEIYSDLQSASIEYTAATYQQFDALKKIASDATKVSKSVNYQNVAYLYNGEPTTEGEQTLFADYLLPTSNGTIQFVMTVTDDVQTLPAINFNTAIPVQANYLTTIKGAILTDPGKVTVEIKDAFEQPENIVDVISGTKTETMELTEESYLFDSITFNVENGPAILVKSGCNVAIDIMDSMTINADQGIVVEDGATLTINGVAETRSASRAGRLVINASEGSAIGGNDITINNLASLVAVGNGNHAFGIGGPNAEVTINNTQIDYVAGGHIQALFVNDTKYGKSEPEGGAAIGGKKVAIENSIIVKAEGGSKAAAIGNSYWNSTEVVIKNSELGDIFGGNASAAIGGSRYNGESKHDIKILIENSTITNAVGGEAGAGIGSGYDTHCNQQNYTAVNDIVIKKSNITAKGGKYSPGIGAGYHSAYLTGSIDAESTINSTAGNETFYKDTYTLAQNLGYGVMDPAREFSGENTNVTFTVAGKVIAAPALGVAEGVGKDLADNYYISNAAGLKYVADKVNSGADYFAGKTIVLANDIDLNNEEWTPIGSATTEHGFMGNFDGRGYAIKNLTIKNITPDSDGYVYGGLFGVTEGVDKNNQNSIKNLTIENVDIELGGHIVAAAIAYPYYTALENIAVKGNVSIKGGYYTAGVLAYTRRCVDAKNISIVGNNGSVIEGTQTVGGVISDIQMNGGLTANYSNFKAENLTIKGTQCVGGISGIIGAQNLDGAIVKNVTIVSDDIRTGMISGAFDGVSVITNAVVENVTGADYYIGCLYEGTASDRSSVTINGDVYTYNNGWLVNGYEYVADGLLYNGKEYVVISANGLVALSDMNIKSGETVKLGADIDLTGVEFNGLMVQNWAGKNTFDGQNHTISNWTYEGGKSDMGFIRQWIGPVKNIKFENCHLKTAGRSAVVAGKIYGNIDNVSVNNCSIVDSYWACGIIAGLYNAGSVSNCTVTNSSVKSNGGTAAIVGVFNEEGGERGLKNCSVSNTTINNTGVYGDVYTGGALVGMFNPIYDATFTIEGCTVSDNNLEGGYVYEKYPADESVTIIEK